MDFTPKSEIKIFQDFLENWESSNVMIYLFYIKKIYYVQKL